MTDDDTKYTIKLEEELDELDEEVEQEAEELLELAEEQETEEREAENEQAEEELLMYEDEYGGVFVNWNELTYGQALRYAGDDEEYDTETTYRFLRWSGSFVVLEQPNGEKVDLINETTMNWRMV